MASTLYRPGLTKRKGDITYDEWKGDGRQVAGMLAQGWYPSLDDFPKEGSEVSEEAADEVKAEVEETDELDEMPVEDLRKLAKDMGIDKWEKMRSIKLKKLIREGQVNGVPQS